MYRKNPFRYSEVKRLEIAQTQEQEIKQLYQEALDELREKFKYLLNSGVSYSSPQIRQIKQAKRDIEEAMYYVDSRTENIINNNMSTMVGIVLQNNQSYLNGLGYNSYINNPSIKTDVINRIVTGNIYDNGFTLSKAIWGDNQAKIDEMYRIIAKDLAKGRSMYDISKHIERYVNPKARKDYEWNKMFPGSRKVVDYNAQRLARTTIQHAYQQAFVSATINNPFIEAYQWITSGGHNVCALCIDRETTDEYGLGPGIFPKDELPLDHPNGMCTFDVVVTMTDDEISDTIADWYMGMGDKEMNEKLDEFANYLKNF